MMPSTASPVDWFELASGLIGGLALFLSALDLLSKELQRLAGERLRVTLQRVAGSPWRGLAAGTIATVALDSSSATIVMLIALVDTGLLTAIQALPIVLGANIGTTAATQLLAAGLGHFAPLLFAASLLGAAVFRRPVVRQSFQVAALLALILFALDLMSRAMAPLAASPLAREWLANLGDPLLALLIGAGTTVLLQSSSATMALVIVIASTGGLSLEAGIAVMLGAEIGTCADTLVAAIGRSREALRVGLFHFVFNVVAAGSGVLMLEQLSNASLKFGDQTGAQIAGAQLLFNIVGAVTAFVAVIVYRRVRLTPNT